MDTGRNGYSATFAAAYAVRAEPGAPVSAPCTWEELEGGEVGPRTFTLRNMADRMERVGDLWADMVRRRRSLKRRDRAAAKALAPSAQNEPLARPTAPSHMGGIGCRCSGPWL